jgi:hypothetical protein|nr:MAG TPA: Cas system-associated protein [Caudoviricetes sp.]
MTTTAPNHAEYGDTIDPINWNRIGRRTQPTAEKRHRKQQMTTLTTCVLSRNAKRLAHDSQALHRTLKHDIKGNFLWSLPDRRTLVIQHDEPVHWPDVMPGVITRTHSVEAITPITGVPVQWALIANPTVCVSRGKGRRGKRTPLGEEDWVPWAHRKLDAAINIHEVDATLMPVARGQRHEMTIYHRRVIFTGTGTVACRDTLADIQRAGVGAGKAYGCGLLIVQEAA